MVFLKGHVIFLIPFRFSINDRSRERKRETKGVTNREIEIKKLRQRGKPREIEKIEKEKIQR